MIEISTPAKGELAETLVKFAKLTSQGPHWIVLKDDLGNAIWASRIHKWSISEREGLRNMHIQLQSTDEVLQEIQNNAVQVLKAKGIL